jgi:hypothetical protein
MNSYFVGLEGYVPIKKHPYAKHKDVSGKVRQPSERKCADRLPLPWFGTIDSITR